MKTPVIGISPSIEDGKIKMNVDYANAIITAGGIPFFMPHTGDPSHIAQYASVIDGLLLAGGADVNPARYGEQICFDSVEADDSRDEFEFLMIKKFLPTGKPILGICRGEQVLGVALGGKLFQHIESHKQTDARNIHRQNVTVDKNSRLYEITGKSTLAVNSFHHQAVKAVPEDVFVSARADDGIIEGIESKTHPFLIGVQWHPECFCAEDEAASRIFSAFVTAAKKPE